MCVYVHNELSSQELFFPQSPSPPPPSPLLFHLSLSHSFTPVLGCILPQCLSWCTSWTRLHSPSHSVSLCCRGHDPCPLPHSSFQTGHKGAPYGAGQQNCDTCTCPFSLTVLHTHHLQYSPGWLPVFHGSLKIFPSLSSCINNHVI